LHQQQNSAINLKGFAIGNGWTDPYLQYPAYNTFAFENNLISGVQSALLTAGFKGCQADFSLFLVGD
jgi:carboxypeptidase C (cathepsin A)